MERNESFDKIGAYEFAKSLTMAGIYHQNPGISAEKADEIFAWRIWRCKQAEEYARKLRHKTESTERYVGPKLPES